MSKATVPFSFDLIKRGNGISNHRHKCIAKGKICINCEFLNPFCKNCRKPKIQNSQNPRKRSINTVYKAPHPKNSVNFIQSSTIFESVYSNDDDNMIATVHDDLTNIKPLKMPFEIGNNSTNLLVDYGSACSLSN